MRGHLLGSVFACMLLSLVLLPSVEAEIRAKRVVVFPTQVHLGEPFVIRIDLAFPSGGRVSLAEEAEIGQARLLNDPQIRTLDRSSKDAQIRLNVAIFFSRTFGSQTLRFSSLPIRTPEGSEITVTFEPPTVVLQRKYRDDQAFPSLRSDLPSWWKPPAHPALEPAHDWSLLPDLRPPPESRGFWLSLLVGGSFLLLALVGYLLLRRSQTRKNPLPPPSPLEEALRLLQALPRPSPHDPAAISTFSSACSGILRKFLHKRLRLDVIGLTSREIRDLTSTAPPFPWSSSLFQCLQNADAYAFLPSPAEPSALPSDIERLLSQIEAWKRAQEAGSADSESFGGSTPDPPQGV